MAVSIQTKWGKRLPRKPPERQGDPPPAQRRRDEAAQPEQMMAKRRRHAPSAERLASAAGAADAHLSPRLPAASPASLALPADIPKGRDSYAEHSSESIAVRMARRLASGRTEAVLASLQDAGVFRLDDSNCHPQVQPQGLLEPRRGVQAVHGDVLVYILDTFERRGSRQADVAELRRSRSSRGTVSEGDEYVLGRTYTCAAAELTDVQYGFALNCSGRGTVTLTKAPGAATVASGASALAAALTQTAAVPAGARPMRAWEATAVKDIVPASALAHVAECAAAGEAHQTYPINRHTRPQWVLDLPLPHEFRARPHRCSTCQARSQGRGAHAGVPKLLLSSSGSSDGSGCNGAAPPKSYFAVQDADVRLAFPGVLVCKGRRQRKVFMTPHFLFELLQSFFEHLNARQVRRYLASMYAANALSATLRLERSPNSPYSLAWHLAALPGTKAPGKI